MVDIIPRWWFPMVVESSGSQFIYTVEIHVRDRGLFAQSEFCIPSFDVFCPCGYDIITITITTTTIIIIIIIISTTSSPPLSPPYLPSHLSHPD